MKILKGTKIDNAISAKPHILTQDDLKTTQVVKVELQYITDKNFFFKFYFLNFIKKTEEIITIKNKDNRKSEILLKK